jgi:transposase
MHKNQVNRHLEDVRQQIKGTIWLLDKCGQGYGSHHYPHHIRDRISEALIKDLDALTDTIEKIQNEIRVGLEDGEEKDRMPF